MTGHAASAPPAPLMAPTIGLHLLAAAFWFGAVAPLFAATRTKSPVEAGFLKERFSKLAVVGVGVLFVTGAAISWVQTAALSGLFTTPYGGRLLVKLVLFAVLLGLATYNKWILTPRLGRNDADAARGFRRSIAWELALYIGVLAVAALLSLSAPPRG
jgi:copper transport protein